MITKEAVMAIRRELSEAEGEKAEHFDVMNEHFEALLDIAEVSSEMYEALKYAIRFLDPKEVDVAWLKRITAKAEGKS